MGLFNLKKDKKVKEVKSLEEQMIEWYDHYGVYNEEERSLLFRLVPMSKYYEDVNDENDVEDNILFDMSITIEDLDIERITYLGLICSERVFEFEDIRYIGQSSTIEEMELLYAIMKKNMDLFIEMRDNDDRVSMSLLKKILDNLD